MCRMCSPFISSFFFRNSLCINSAFSSYWIHNNFSSVFINRAHRVYCFEEFQVFHVCDYFQLSGVQSTNLHTVGTLLYVFMWLFKVSFHLIWTESSNTFRHLLKNQSLKNTLVKDFIEIQSSSKVSAIRTVMHIFFAKQEWIFYSHLCRNCILCGG